MDFRRQTLAGSPQQGTSSASAAVVAPLQGFIPQGNEFLQPPGSFSSGQNVWVRNGSLEPRWRLSAQSITSLSGAMGATGDMTNPTVNGVFYSGVIPFVFSNDSSAGAGAVNSTFWVASSKATLGPNNSAFAASYFSSTLAALAWEPMSYSSRPSYASGVAGSVAGSGTTFENLRGAVVYSAPLNRNLLVMSLGSNRPLLATSGEVRDVGTGGFQINAITYSILSGAIPTAVDITNFGNRPVAWHCGGVPTRCQWTIEGDPTDWTGLGSGFQDITDMNGVGTRIFSQSDQMVLATTEEIWRGRAVGLPYVFAFSPIERKLGMPYPRATLQTPAGIFWLDRNFMVYQMVGEQIQPLGTVVQDYLRAHLRAPELAFLVYNSLLNQLRLFYSMSATSYPTHAIVFSLDNQTVAHEVYQHAFHIGTSNVLAETGGQTFSVPVAGPGPNFAPDGVEHPLGLYSVLVTSAGTCGALTESAGSDLGQNVAEELTFGPTCVAPLRKETLVEARYDLAARSASSLTASWSSDFGKTVGQSQALSVASESHSSQIITNPKYTAQNLSLKLQSTNGGWQLRRITTITQDDGRAN